MNAGNGNLFMSGGFPENRWDELVAESIDPVDLDLSATHFGLGLWIRNNWIYPSPYSNIAHKLFIVGVRHPDDMSSIIINGYHRYLNDIPYRTPIQTRAFVGYAFIALIFSSSLVLIIIGKYKNKSK